MCPKPFSWAKNKRKLFSDGKSRGPLLAREVFLFSLSTGNNSFNVNNGSLVFIDKNGSQTHQSHKHFPHQLLSKAPSEFQNRKHVLRAARLEAIYCDLARVI